MATFTIRIPDDLHARLKARARTEHRSVNAEIVHLLETVLNSPADAGPRASNRPDSPPA
ncbi:FitA-like ribbon-helix-helix domain-containing protein [Glycomyces salinus]|uniref:FitA-like ribbon-helix-helix domain-containing protein n=1 Tax=Glycomyces salinus TaxID=980294 RepID=UPI0018EB4F97|nr:Arc family DNA-binding protein [Glycomyces salinus]